MELQGRYAEITRQGLGLAAILYEPPETLKRFADSRGITFPLVSDPGSAIIRRYGLFNETVDPKVRAYGVPHPGTFILDRQGRVVARFFEEAYRERYTAATVLTAIARGTSGDGAPVQTKHLTATIRISDTAAAPGHRLAITADVAPRPSMHVYAPGKHGYQIVQLRIDPQPWLRVHDTVYPASEIYHFEPLDERVEVYGRAFRLRRDVTVLATAEAQKLLGGLASVEIAGTLEYQACDDTICYNPARVPFSFPIQVKTLDRKPAGR